MRSRGSTPAPCAPARACLGRLLALLAILAAASRCPAGPRSERFIGPGTRLLRWTVESGPHAVYAVEADASDPFLRFGVALPAGALRLEPLSKQAEAQTTPDRYPIAGVNGDFFYYPSAQQPGIPTNAVVSGGELIRTPFERSCLILGASGGAAISLLRARGSVTLPGGIERALDGLNQPRGAGHLVLFTPRFGASTRTKWDGTEVYLEPESFPLQAGVGHRAIVRAVQKGVGDAPIAAGRWVLSGAGQAGEALSALAPGDAVQIRIDLDPPLKPGDEVLGGGPRLLRDGRISVESEGGTLGESFAKTRHPRTAVGIADAGGRPKLLLVVTDGRQPGYSAGMSLYELAQVMLDLGCTDALNLDGGGSSTLWVRGEVVNRPSDGRERAVANGLLLFSTAPRGEPVRIRAEPEEIRALAGAEAALSAAGEDRYYNPIPIPAEQLRWEVPAALGVVEGGRFRAREDARPEPGSDAVSGVLVVEAGSARGELPVRVSPRPARLELLPAAARLGPGGRARFRVRALDAAGRPLLLPASVSWSADASVGAIGPDGTLAAAAAPARGEVRVMVNGVSASAAVEVAEAAAAALEDFESGPPWGVRVSPAGTAGTVSIAEGMARGGKKSLRIDYDFTTGSGTRAVYALAQRPLGAPFALKAWVYGDGENVWLRARVRAADGSTHTLDLARRVDWKGSWRELRAAISDDIPTPITLEAIYVVEPDASAKPRGSLYIDDLTVER